MKMPFSCQFFTSEIPNEAKFLRAKDEKNKVKMKNKQKNLEFDGKGRV